MSLLVRCPAKVNLHLEVLGRRADGFHELRTLIAAIDVWDELELEPAPPGVVEVEVEPAGAVSCGEDNLVVRAARALAAAGCAGGARILLRKRIPVGGGLGGGSANAAAALVGLAHLWGCRPEPARLLPLAAGLGSDVPFFLLGGAAWGVGRGSEVYPLPDLPRWWLVLLPAEAPVATRDVYAALDCGGVDEWVPSAVYHWLIAGGEPPLAACRNDLEPTVVARWPEVARRLEALRRTGALLAQVSGSGGTVFAVFGSEARAREVAEHLDAFGPLVAATLTRRSSLLRPSAGEVRWTSQR